MIPNKEKEGWHYLAVKKLSALLRGITSKHDGDFHCLNCLHFFRVENKLKHHEKVSTNKNLCGIAMPWEKDNILEFNQYMKSDEMPYNNYADIESLSDCNGTGTHNHLVRKWTLNHLAKLAKWTYIHWIFNFKKTDGCASNSDNSKIGEHIICGYLMSTM